MAEREPLPGGRPPEAGSDAELAARAGWSSWAEPAAIFVAFNFGVAQPLLDLLGKHAQFFVSHRSPKMDIVLVAMALTIVAPALLAAAAGLVTRVHLPAGRWIGRGLIALLIGAFALQLAPRGSDLELGGRIQIAAALIVGVMFVAALVRLALLRTFVLYLSASSLLFTGTFLLATPVRRLVSPRSAVSPAGVIIGAASPLAILVFDELPATSILDAAGQLDPLLLPNFARLASDGSWYRNATTVSDDTTWAFPAMLSGKYPSGKRSLPIPSEHPNTLFSLLQGAYRINCLEPVTRLCPVQAGDNGRPERPFPLRMREIWSDLAVVYLHQLLPRDLTRGLPSIEAQWKGFGRPRQSVLAGSAADPEPQALTLEQIVEEIKSDRRGPYRAFLDGISDDPKSLHFAHLLLPHAPYDFLASGQRYKRERQPDPSRIDGPWLDEEWSKIHEYQRHLLQVEFVDRVVGDLIARLEAVGLYERALVIVTADHGVAFHPGDHRRIAATATLGEIAYVPLFVKRPYQAESHVSERPVELIDLVPLVAEVLELELPWEIDGQSLSAAESSRQQRLVFSPMAGRFVLGLGGEARDAALRRKWARFEPGPGPITHYRVGVDGDLVGQPASALRIGGQSPLRVRVDRLDELAKVDPSSGFVPAYLGGQILSGASEDATVRLAVALNGTVAGVTRATETEKGSTRFALLLWPALFQPGNNRIELFAVASGPAGKILHPVAID